MLLSDKLLAQNKDETPEVRRATWLALGKLGRLVPLEVFLEVAQDKQEFIDNYVVYAVLTRGNTATLASCSSRARPTSTEGIASGPAITSNARDSR